jgi:hypothetical protein
VTAIDEVALRVVEALGRYAKVTGVWSNAYSLTAGLPGTERALNGQGTRPPAASSHRRFILPWRRAFTSDAKVLVKTSTGVSLATERARTCAAQKASRQRDEPVRPSVAPICHDASAMTSA